MLAEWRGVTSASRVYGNYGYEISDDLRRRRVEVLEKRYGGREQAHAAAVRIQRAFRQHRMNSRFRQMMTSSDHQQMNGFASNGHTPERIRYAPTTSLSAQLRADHRAVNDKICRTRSPPSPSPRGRQDRSMIDSLMSPRLVSRRMPGALHGAPMTANHQSQHASPHAATARQTSASASASSHSMSPSTAHSFSPSGSRDLAMNGIYVSHVAQNGHSNVWVPQGNGAHQAMVHCNSLPRLEKKRHAAEPAYSPKRMTEIERKRQYRIALNFFNKKPERGIQLLMAWGFVDDNAQSVARLLFGRRGLSRQMVGEYLGVLRSSFNSCVLQYFLGEVDTRGLEVDCALRKCLTLFRLPGESQKIERIMEVFSQHYAMSNPTRVKHFRGGHKTVFILAYAIIMLNTDLHNKSIKQSEKMKKDQFVNNLRGVDEGGNIDREVLCQIYDRIRDEEFRTGDDHVAQVARVDAAIQGHGKPILTETPRRLVCYCRLNQIMDVRKKQPSTSHERDVFLFNDMIVTTKASGVAKRSGAQLYALKMHSPLLGARVESFNNPQYDFGIMLILPDNQRVAFNARNYEDLCRFVADVKESISETQAMESVRLELEMERISLRSESQRDSGLPDGEEDPEAAGQPRPLGPPGSRRLSGHSLDSGVVEEGYDVHA